MCLSAGMNTADLIALCDVYAAHRGVSHWRVAVLAGCGGGFFQRLRGGGGCTLRTAHRLLQWFSDNWPEDLPWPADTPRPPKAKKEAA